MPRPSPSRYRTTNRSEYDAVLRRRGSLSVWFDVDTGRHAGKTGKRGRPGTFPDAAIQTCLTLKGEGRLGNDPADRFRPERAEPRSAFRCGRRSGRSGARSGWLGSTGRLRTIRRRADGKRGSGCRSPIAARASP
ncbi:probable transposase [Sagittula stellata E-37]|uniref:Probable transposase n=1 Tax=Sagittula stellata (strain ATCC 700073 / DSM 11524 / E-37) TaxID=388399 RepID=A3KBA0_SAGS3|nr:probable transposase [Sagittula stellata E-37]